MMKRHSHGGLVRRINGLFFASALVAFASSSWGDPSTAEKEIQVFIDRQVLVAFENGKEIYSFDIVT